MGITRTTTISGATVSPNPVQCGASLMISVAVSYQERITTDDGETIILSADGMNSVTGFIVHDAEVITLVQSAE